MRNRFGCNNSYLGEPDPSTSHCLTLACTPPASIGVCKNTANLKFLPCQDPNVDSMGIQAGVIEYTNRLRANMNRAPLVNDSGLTVGAQFRANDMTQNNYFSHTDLMGRSPQAVADFLSQTDQRIWTDCVFENIAANSNNPSAYVAFAQWFCSTDGHFEAMTNPELDRVGIGFAKAPNGQNTLYPFKWVMWLASSTKQFPFSCGPGGTCETGWKRENDNWAYYELDNNGNCVRKKPWVFNNEPDAMRQVLGIPTNQQTNNWYSMDQTTGIWSHWVWNQGNWYFFWTDNNTWYLCQPVNGKCKWVQQSSAPI